MNDESGKFSWDEDDCVVIRRANRTAVYTNPNDDVVIRQTSPFNDEDVFIVIPKERVEALCRALYGELED